MNKIFFKKIAEKAAIAVFWLFVWWLLHIIFNRNVFFPSPLRTVQTLLALVTQASFWLKVLVSMLRFLLGFLFGCLAGALFSFLTDKSKILVMLFQPVLTLFKNVPATSVIMLLWLALFRYKGIVPVAASALTVLPIVWEQMSNGHRTMDAKLLEMAKCCANRFDTFLYIRLPHLFPYFISGVSVSIGLAWKAGLTAEVICTPAYSIGNEIHTAHAYLESDVLLSWTAVTVVLCTILESVLVRIIKKLHFRPKLRHSEFFSENGSSFPLQFDRINKCYGKQKVLDRFTHMFPNGKVTAILGHSGCGKTTMLSIAAGLLLDDACAYRMPPTASGIIFQENRLIPNLTVKENILFANRGANTKQIMKLLALTDFADRYPPELNDSIQRRVAIGRAISFCGGIGIFDEPFARLDEETKALCAQALFSSYKGKTVLFATQHEEDASRYGDEILKMV